MLGSAPRLGLLRLAKCLVCVFALILVAAVVVVVPAQAQRVTSGVGGSVADAVTGEAIPAVVRIDALGGATPPRFVPTDSVGYRVRTGDGRFALTAYAFGYVAASDTVAVAGGFAEATFLLERAFAAFASVSGQIYDAQTNTTVGGARVRFEARGDTLGGGQTVGRRYEATADAGGNYGFYQVVPGTYTLTVTHPDYLPYRTEVALRGDFPHAAIPRLQPRNPQVPSSGRLRIFLTDGVTGERLDGMTYLASTTGSFRMSGGMGGPNVRTVSVPNDTYVAYAYSIGYEDARIDTVTVRGDVQWVQFEMVPTFEETASVSGTVTRSDGSIVRGIRVFAEARRSIAKPGFFTSTLAQRYPTRTDSSGTYAIDGLPPSTYRLVAGDNDRIDGETSVTLADGEVGVADITTGLPPEAYDLPGRVLARATDAPVPGARARLYFEDPARPGRVPTILPYVAASARTDSAGLFTMKAVWPDTVYVLAIEADGYDSLVVRSVRVRPGMARATYRLAPAALQPVAGTVTSEADGAPLAGARVTVFGEGRAYTTRTDSAGAYTVDVLRTRDRVYQASVEVASADSQSVALLYYPGVTELRQAERFAVWDSTIVTARGPVGTIDFVLPQPDPRVRTQISGHITDPAGAPISGASVAFSGWADGARVHLKTYSRRDGSYRVSRTSLPIDSLYGYAEAPGYVSVFYGGAERFEDATPLVLADTARVLSGIDFVLRPEGEPEPTTISGSVSGTGGAPVVGAVVIALQASGALAGYVVTQSDGRFAVPAGRGASYRLLVIAPGYVPAFAGASASDPAPLITGGTSGLVVRLLAVGAPRDVATLTGRVRLPDGTAAAEAMIFVEGDGAETLGAALAAADGTYRIDGVRPGAVTVRVRYGGTFTGSTSHTVHAGQQTTLDFTVSDARQVANESGEAPVTELRLGGAYPNPFTGTTTIPFALPEAGRVELSIYDPLGRRVAVVAQGVWAAGEHTAPFDAEGLSSGVYLYRLQTERAQITRRLTLIR